MHNYENLQVRQRSMELTVNVYRATAKFPSDERFGLTSQLRRAASSIPMNIAEGSGNLLNREFCRCLEIALRSGYEVLTGIEIARRWQLLTAAVAAELTKEVRNQRHARRPHSLSQQIRQSCGHPLASSGF